MFNTFYKTGENKRKYYIHSPTPALALTLTIALTLNDLANEALQTATTQYGLMYLTYGCAMDYTYFIRCVTNYKQLLK